MGLGSGSCAPVVLAPGGFGLAAAVQQGRTYQAVVVIYRSIAPFFVWSTPVRPGLWLAVSAILMLRPVVPLDLARQRAPAGRACLVSGQWARARKETLMTPYFTAAARALSDRNS